MAVTPDGTRIVTASKDRTVKVWNLDTGTIVATFTADGALDACAAPHDGRYCAAGASGRIHILDLIHPAPSDP